MKDYLYYYFDTDQQIADFALWAFGPGYYMIRSAKGYMKAWNKLHKDELHLRPDGLVITDIHQMVALYRRKHANY